MPSASPDCQFCHNPYHPAPTFSQRYNVAPISVHSSTQTTDQGQRDLTGISSTDSKHAMGSTDHIKYIFLSKQSTNDRQKRSPQQTARSEADTNERASCQAELEDTNDSDDSWHSIRRQKRDFNKGPQVSSGITPDICKECNLEFHLTDDEAAWFTKQGLHRPLRCLACLQARRL